MLNLIEIEYIFRRGPFNMALDVLFRVLLIVIWNLGPIFLCTNISWCLNFIAFNLKGLKIVPLNAFIYFIAHLIFFNQELEPEKKRARIHHETRIHILNLLITSLECSPPSLALYLLGYELKKPVSTTNLQDPGMSRNTWCSIFSGLLPPRVSIGKFMGRSNSSKCQD